MTVRTTIEQGTLYWLTGLSGAGKTTIGEELVRLLRIEKDNVVFLDGDALRQIFSDHQSFSSLARRKLAMQYAQLCKMLTDQGLDVVCATICMFEECRAWNRDHIPHYREIYIRVPLNVLKERDSKNIYSRAFKGELRNVMGVDIPFEEPQHPDIVLDNDGTKHPKELAKVIYEYCC